ncbi:exocyst complex component 3 [Nematostella vectensis]|uniref:exocyst complex component 3 n=1 Tax=Nematostella vectensis TaxID=45351 RepID=UPI0020775C0D|nr:exocyst complex component 3 [Nematostella vectensis]
MSIDLQNAKAEAHENAAKLVATMLQNPDSLDKVEQWRRRVMRNKASVEARLKTAVQSQLEGVRTGLGQLQGALQDIKQIKQSMEEVDGNLKGVSKLAEDLEQVKQVQYRHSQLSKCNELLNHIFNVPENVEKAYILISDGKLLLAHKCLADLEATRDEFLFEVHKMSQSDDRPKTDQSPLHDYFRDVAKLSETLGKQLWLVLQRFHSSVRSDPAQLVTALRIIEREERADKRAELRLSSTGFKVPGRPKRWKQKCFEVIESGIGYRFESLEMHIADERLTEKMWLVKHLERTRQKVLDDLTVIKNLCQPCFPPSYNIFDKAVQMYHAALSLMLERTVCEQRLDSNECVSILAWIREYGGIDLMMHPDLQVDVEFLPPLLSSPVHKDLVDTYINTTSTNIKEWMKKMIESDEKDWHKNTLPEKDADGFFNTSLPVFLYQMVDQNMQVAGQTGEDIKMQILDIGMEELQGFQREYRKSLRQFKAKHFEDRSQPPRFIEYMIAIVNNCMMCINFTEQFRDRMEADFGRAAFGEDRQQIFKGIISCFETIGEEGCRYLLDEVFLDLNPFFIQIMTPAWVTSTNQVDTIIVTIEDYSRDYTHMKPRFFDYLVDQALERSLIEYVRAMMNKRIAFKNYDERKSAASKILDEAKKFEKLFTKLTGRAEEVIGKCSVLPTLTEVIKLRDTSMMALEISGIANKYPDFKSDHAMALLLMRGDVGRIDARQLILETPLKDMKEGEQVDQGRFFDQIIVPPSLLDKMETAWKSKPKS